MAQKKRKSLVRSTGRVEEADLLRKARHLAENPSAAAPRCVCGNNSCPSRRLARAIEKVSRDGDDEKKLASHAGGFFTHPVVRAYAATLLLAKADTIPYVANMRVVDTVVPYAMRGGAFKEELVGFQHHDDRVLRLLAFHRLVRKQGLNYYSMPDGLVCSGRSPQPPDEFVAEKARELGLTAKAPGFYACPHISVVPESDHLMLTWRGTNARFLKCAKCAGPTNSLSRILTHIGTASPREHFKFEARPRRLNLYGGEEPPVPLEPPSTLFDDYWKGKSSDAEVMKRAIGWRRDELKKLKGPVYVNGDRYYGGDARLFIESLEPDDLERAALKAMLKGYDGVVLAEDESAVKVIDRLFPTRGLLALVELAGDETLAKDLFAGAGGALDKLRAAERRSRRMEVVGRLPSFKALAPDLEVLDAVSKELRAHGRQAALRIIVSEEKRRPSLAPLAAAVRRVLGGTRGEEWTLSKEESELADYATPLVKELLECGPESYSAAMESLAKGLGLPAPEKA